ncbi:MAG: HIT domain-containing protein [Clostridiales bacterium]|nr:HIT domain-containing protein [Clostridiales bacterium]
MCLFCDIAAHKVPGVYVVNETDMTISFLDIAPANEGHVLIIPKLHVDSIVDLPDEYVQEITGVARKLVKAFEKVYGAKGYGIMQNGGANCEFGHFHLHVFPRLENDGYDWIYPEGEKEVSEGVAAKLKNAMPN